MRFARSKPTDVPSFRLVTAWSGGMQSEVGREVRGEGIEIVVGLCGTASASGEEERGGRVLGVFAL